MTEALRTALPALYAQDGLGNDATVHGKWFTPDAQWTWYLLEYDGRDELFTLAVSDQCPDGELGYTSLSEVEAARGPFGLPVERDLYFTPTTMGAVRETVALVHGWVAS